MHIRSFSKSHGPDLRLAAVGGAGDIVVEVANRRLLGPGWSSRILQAVLVEMLDDRATIDAVDAARREYARRRAAGVAVLDAHGVPATGTDGINLWMRVADERGAAVASPRRASASLPANRSSSAPTTTTSASRSAWSTTADSPKWPVSWPRPRRCSPSRCRPSLTARQ